MCNSGASDPVQGVAVGATVSIISCASGVNTNYALSVTDSGPFSATASGSAMSALAICHQRRSCYGPHWIPGAEPVSRGDTKISWPNPLVPNQEKKIYLVGPSKFSLCRSTRFYTAFGSIWSQIGLRFWYAYRRHFSGGAYGDCPDRSLGAPMPVSVNILCSPCLGILVCSSAVVPSYEWLP
jgi:hypothetical protein